MISETESKLLACLFLLYFAATFVWPTIRIWRQTGVSPYVMSSTDDVYGFVTSGFRMVMISLAAFVILQALYRDSNQFLGAMQWIMLPIVRSLAWSGLVASLVWTIVAQFQMDRSWRIGIDRERRTDLVTTGLFAYSRNPIFLAMRLSLLSLFLLAPNAVTLAIWLVGDVLIQFQVRLEEAFLSKHHGSRYKAYYAKTRRWI